MKRIAKILAVISTFTAIAFAADNTLGTWKYNAAKSKIAAGARPYKSLIITRQGKDDGVKQTVQVEDAEGIKSAGFFTAKYDGESVPMGGTLNWDTVSEKQLDADTVSEELAKQGSKSRATRLYKVSADGKTMIVTTSGTDEDGNAFTQMFAFDKQPGSAGRLASGQRQ